MRLKLDDTNNFSENSNINQDGDTNQNEDDIIKDKYEKLTQLAGIYSCLHNILVNLKSSGDENKRYCFVEVNNKPEDFFNKIIVEVIIPLEKFISTNEEYMKVNCIFDRKNYGVNSDILHKIVATINLVKNICDNRYNHVEDMLETIMFLDGLMRIGCYIMDVLIFHYNEIYKEKKQHGEVMTFSDGFKALLKDVGIFGYVEENRYKDLVFNLMRLYVFVLDFNESIDKNLNASDVFSDKNFKCAYNLILNVFRNFYYVFLFMVKFYSLDLIVKKMIDDNVMEYHIKNIFNFTYNFSCIIRVFLHQFLSNEHSNCVKIGHTLNSCLKCLLSLLCDVTYFREGVLSDDIRKNAEKLVKGGNDIDKNFLYSISFKNFLSNISFEKFIGNCRALLDNQVSLNVELNDKMNNLDTEIIDVNEVMSISDDYSSISRVKVPLKEIDDNNRFVDCVSCRSKVQITDINKID